MSHRRARYRSQEISPGEGLTDPAQTAAPSGYVLCGREDCPPPHRLSQHTGEGEGLHGAEITSGFQTYCGLQLRDCDGQLKTELQVSQSTAEHLLC